MFALKKIYIVLITAGLLLTACGAQGAGNTKEVKINLTEFGIESSVTDFKVGVLYHFVVTNAGNVDHEIMVMPPLMEESMGMPMDMGELDKTALVMIEASELTPGKTRSEEHTSELQSRGHLVCRLLLEKKKKKIIYISLYNKKKKKKKKIK